MCTLPEVLYCSVDERSVFWNRVASVQPDLLPLFRLSTCVAGCPCHEDALVAGKVIRCPRKGCRGPELSYRVHHGVLKLAYGGDKLREEGAAVGMRDEAASLLLAKFNWARELPCIMWHARRFPASAQALLQEFHSAWASEEERPHLNRVAVRPYSDLREPLGM